MAEIRVNDDCTQVAIRREGEVPDDHPLAWGVMTVENGGHLGPFSMVEHWAVVPVSPKTAAVPPAAAKS